jgi:hypothetical protein
MIIAGRVYLPQRLYGYVQEARWTCQAQIGTFDAKRQLHLLEHYSEKIGQSNGHPSQLSYLSCVLREMVIAERWLKLIKAGKVACSARDATFIRTNLDDNEAKLADQLEQLYRDIDPAVLRLHHREQRKNHDEFCLDKWLRLNEPLSDDTTVNLVLKKLPKVAKA